MNDLQIALLAVAAALLVALFVWSKWQERRALRRFQQSLQSGVEDALLTPAAASALQPAAHGPADFRRVLDAELNVQRREPTFEPGSRDPAPAAHAGEADAEPTAEAEPDAAPEWIEDPMLDCVLELRCAHAVDGVAVFDAAAPLAQSQLPLPVHVVVWDARTQRWVRPDRFGFYTELLVAVQLAHRRVQLGEIEVARFLSAVQQVALRLDADFDAPEAAHIQTLASQLGETCARFDVQVGLTLESASGPWDGVRLAHAATLCGLQHANGHHWERRDASGRMLFRLVPLSLLTDRLMLELDVPLAPVEGEPLRLMFSAAKQMASTLRARLVDDNGRPIDAASIAAIEAQLQALVAEMRAAGIEPGGARAARLYGAPDG